VKGVEGLRVCDASAMPSQITGNLYATVIAIAEKAADMILGKKPLPAEYPEEKINA
jgi:choline dehydrogenase